MLAVCGNVKIKNSMILIMKNLAELDQYLCELLIDKGLLNVL